MTGGGSHPLLPSTQIARGSRVSNYARNCLGFQALSLGDTYLASPKEREGEGGAGLGTSLLDSRSGTLEAEGKQGTLALGFGGLLLF